MFWGGNNVKTRVTGEDMMLEKTESKKKSTKDKDLDIITDDISRSL